MLNQQQIFVSERPVPSRPVFSLAVLAHVVVLVLAVVRYATAPHIVPTKLEVAQTISGSAHIAYSAAPKTLPPAHSLIHLPQKQRQRKAQKLEPAIVGNGNGTAVEALRADAKQATANLMVGMKQRLIYGFSTNHYDLAVQTAGAIPNISPNDLPPRFEQYLIVEVTIDTEGHVADARFTTGMATPKIEQTLLAAIKEFKYTPAKRDGTPIPCQVDIVIHIPS
jgi:Gram-negative bacterial TonB protein C-terminal